ncbi:hypothetical protein bcCo53_001260 (plasmid) [Borrelia coriaceae]|uniref:Uncharacterized protein n=1 Tax=Borrelia coriaceae ATCC 43381 TaxID=1408429 RepID=W5T1R7_9SPIR|nr:hypothetical protein [Borrelia coriaceae]AHH11216.1 hypothetical protein BCO_0900051 [Borrelia coriaceae ATCC 43381]UPA17091.1 hypothetical protein bcCo53_001260 [Borrelia coriaceae]
MIGKYANALNALLVLLLLMLMLPVISCDSKRDPHVGSRKPPGTSTLIRNRRDDSRGFAFGFNSLPGRPAVPATPVVVKPAAPEEEPPVVVRPEGGLEVTDHAGSRSKDGGTESQDSSLTGSLSINERISRLMSTLKLPEEDGGIITYVLSIVEDDSDLKVDGVDSRAETAYLEQLERANSNDLRGMIDTVRAVLGTQTAADQAINGVSRPKLKDSFRNEFNDVELRFKKDLKLQVGIPSFAEDFLGSLNLLKDRYTGNFISIRDLASTSNIRIEDLDADTREALNAIKEIVIRSDLGDPSLPVLSDVGFAIFWQGLDSHQLGEVVKIYRAVKSMKNDTSVEIGKIKLDISREEIQGLFNRSRNELYPNALKNLCNNATEFERYKRVLEEVKDGFGNTLSTAQKVVQGETIYEGLSGNDKRLIDDVRDLIVDKALDDPADPFDDHYYYDYVLGNYGLERMKKLRTVNLKNFFDVREQAQAAVASVSDSEKRQKLEDRLKDCKLGSAKLIRELLTNHASDYIRGDKKSGNDIIADVNNEDVVKEFLKIIEAAVKAGGRA